MDQYDKIQLMTLQNLFIRTLDRWEANAASRVQLQLLKPQHIPYRPFCDPLFCQLR